MNRIKEAMAATYVQISRDELESWLDSLRLPMRWKRQENRAGIYLLPLSSVVAIKLSSTVGSRDDALGAGKASMQLSLISTVTGQTLNKKAQGQSHFKRTTNWKTTWADGIKRMRAAYMKAQGFYDAIAVIEDRDQYKQDTLVKIEGIPNWQQNSMLSDFHFSVEKGGILTEKQMGALENAARRSESAPTRAPAPRGNNVWTLTGGASGEEEMTFIVERNGVTLLVNPATADGVPVSESKITFEEAADIWIGATESRDWYPGYARNDPPPFLQNEASKPVVDEVLIERVRNLYRQAYKLGDQFLLDFATNIGKALKDGRPLSPKQTAFMEKSLAKYRLASSRNRLASRIASLYMSR